MIMMEPVLPAQLLSEWKLPEVHLFLCQRDNRLEEILRRKTNADAETWRIHMWRNPMLHVYSQKFIL